MCIPSLSSDALLDMKFILQDCGMLSTRIFCFDSGATVTARLPVVLIDSLLCIATDAEQV